MPVGYGLNSTRVTTQEYLWDTHWLLTPLIWLIKLLRIRLNGSTDDPPVDQLGPFEVSATDWPDGIRDWFREDIERLRALGYQVVIVHRIALPRIQTQIYRATLVHPSGQRFVRLQLRIWSQRTPPQERYHRQLETEFEDGTYLITFAGKPDMLAPPSMDIERIGEVTLDELIRRHDERLALTGRRDIRSVRSVEEVRAYVERQHAQLVDFHRARGVFEPLPTSQSTIATDPTADPATAHSDVLAELEHLQQRRVSWVNSIFILVLSLAVFAAVFWFQAWEISLWLIIPILLFHEAGHWVAMKLFGYRNTRMFFIPFFGAGVSGQNLNVAGWKKAIVALAGPLPGIAVGAAIGISGLIHEEVWKVQLAMAAILLNGFNLLPILPLDGGVMWQAILFCRHRYLDLAFRCVTIGCLMLMALALNAYILFGVGIMMALALPIAYKIAQVAEGLREQKFSTHSPDGVTIPQSAAVVIIQQLREALPTGQTPKTLAQHTWSVFETLNARPPGIVVSLGFAGLYAGSLLASFILLGVFFLGASGDFWDVMQMAAGQPTHVYRSGATETVQTDADVPLDDQTLLGSFPSEQAATEAFQRLVANGDEGQYVRFGQSMMVRVAHGDVDRRNALFDLLENEQASPEVLGSDVGGWFRFQAVMPGPEVAEQVEQQLMSYSFSLETVPLHLIPPWSREWADAGPQREVWAQRRQLARDLMELVAEDDEDFFAELYEQLEEASRRGDNQRREQILDQIRQRNVESLRQVFDAYVHDGEGAADQQIIDAIKQWRFEQLEQMGAGMRLDDDAAGQAPLDAGDPPAAVDASDQEAPHDPQPTADGDDPAAEQPRPAGPAAAARGLATPGEAALSAIAPLLGQLELNERGEPLGAARDQVMSYMWAERAGPVVECSGSATFPGTVLPQLAEWLCDQGAVEVRYDIGASY